MDDDLWRLEERLWLGGEPAYQALLDPACLMAFPGVGVLDAAAVLASIREAPRWSEIAMENRRLTHPGAELAVLAYRAQAVRDGGDPYGALCTSTWRREGDGWRMVQHQQAPLG